MVKRSNWYSRHLAVRRVKMGDVLGRVIVAALLVYVALIFFHLTQGFSFTSALGGGIQDIRVVAVCFGEWGEMKEFIARDSLFGKDPGGLALDLSGGNAVLGKRGIVELLPKAKAMGKRIVRIWA